MEYFYGDFSIQQSAALPKKTITNVSEKILPLNQLRCETTVISPAGIYLFKVDNRNNRTSCEICSKVTKKTSRTTSF